MLRILWFYGSVYGSVIFLLLLFVYSTNRMSCYYYDSESFRTEYRLMGGCFVEHQKGKWIPLKYFRVNGN